MSVNFSSFEMDALLTLGQTKLIVWPKSKKSESEASVNVWCWWWCILHRDHFLYLHFKKTSTFAMNSQVPKGLLRRKAKTAAAFFRHRLPKKRPIAYKSFSAASGKKSFQTVLLKTLSLQVAEGKKKLIYSVKLAVWLKKVSTSSPFCCKLFLFILSAI